MNERADSAAYGYFLLMAFLVIGTLAWVVCVPLVNGLAGEMNTDIGDGKISQQTAGSFDFNKGLFLGIPGFTLLGVLLLGVRIALNARKTEQEYY
ncbi:MAG: hypothetical protein WC262_07230 [Bacteroidales bacterium]|jgi:hypothetical protein